MSKHRCAHCDLPSLSGLFSTSHHGFGYCAYHWAGQLQCTPGVVPADKRSEWLVKLAEHKSKTFKLQK